MTIKNNNQSHSLFNIGDQVKLIKADHKTLKQVIGKTGTIENYDKADGDYYVKFPGMRWWISPEDLELVWSDDKRINI